jgi:hypothetical protein
MSMKLQKRRSTTTGLSTEDELKAWRMYFSTGADYFHDLKVLGILRTHVAQRQAAEAAWQRLGSAFLATWAPTPSRPTPWALDELGNPE